MNPLDRQPIDDWEQLAAEEYARSNPPLTMNPLLTSTVLELGKEQLRAEVAEIRKRFCRQSGLDKVTVGCDCPRCSKGEPAYRAGEGI